jgi:hypothetical protein
MHTQTLDKIAEMLIKYQVSHLKLKILVYNRYFI